MRKLLFSVTAADCKWSYTRGTGAGGQKKNKTSSAVHCIHEPSGARGYSEETRSQAKNRQIAFEKMVKCPPFQIWHKMEIMKRTGIEAHVEEYVAREIKKVRVEKKNDKGLWEVWTEE